VLFALGGRGAFLPFRLPGDVTAASSSVAVADVNADGDLDIVFGIATDAIRAVMLLGDGTGEFSINTLSMSTPVTAPESSSHCRAVAIADVNNDGLIDLVLSARYNNLVLSGSGGGEWVASNMLGGAGAISPPSPNSSHLRPPSPAFAQLLTPSHAFARLLTPSQRPPRGSSPATSTTTAGSTSSSPTAISPITCS